MFDAVVLSRLRRFLLIVAGLLFVGTVGELWLINHMEDPVQLLPFVLCGLGTVAVVAVLLRPRRATMLALRVVMSLAVIGSLIGVYLHIESNLAFIREINPNAPTGEVIMGALGGANPLLAPAILALAATLAVAATYYHPALKKGEAVETDLASETA